MIKTRIATIVLICILLIATFSMLNVKSVEATNYNVNWGHQQRPADPDEQYIESVICSDITVMFNSQSNWNSWNAYGYNSMQAYLLGTISWRQANSVWATDFWVGDFFPYSEEGWHYEWQYDGYDWVYVKVYDDVWIDHYCFYGDGHNGGWHWGYDDVRDDAIATYTNYGASAQRFTFIWTCSCGNIMVDPNNNVVYGYYDPYNTGVVGMPLAWTGRTDLSHNAYGGPDSSNYCYLGFQGGSMPLKQQVDGTSWIYGSFVWYFYDYLMYQGIHRSVHDALNLASNTVFGCDYPACPLWSGYWVYNPVFGWIQGWMQTYGNSQISMPYS